MIWAAHLDRRTILCGGASAALSKRLFSRPAALAAQERVISIRSLDALGHADSTRAIQAAINSVQESGGGTVIISGRHRCGNVLISGQNVTIRGEEGCLVDGRLTISPGARNVQVVGLSIIDTTGDSGTYLLDVGGCNCRFTNLDLTKEPIAGGYQMYLRNSATRCRFTGLKTRGSNGIFVAGTEHVFEDFELESPVGNSAGGDDAFAIKAPGCTTSDINIRNGVVRGFSAIVSFGSEIGRPGNARGSGTVRNVLVEDVRAERCSRVAFFKPGALVYDWRDGLVEGVVLRNLSLDDPNGDRFVSGIEILTGRGAKIANVQATDIRIHARAKSQGIVSTAAVHILFLDQGAPSRIEHVTIQLAFDDPCRGAPHAAGCPGFPIDHVAKIEKSSPNSGSLARLTLDLVGDGTSFGGIAIGPGLDDSINIHRAVLTHVGLNPRATAGGAGIWSASRLKLGRVTVQAGKLPTFAGPFFERRPTL